MVKVITERKRKTKQRDKKLNQLGITTLRFDDTELKYDVEKTLKVIEKWIDENA